MHPVVTRLALAACPNNSSSVIAANRAVRVFLLASWMQVGGTMGVLCGVFTLGRCCPLMHQRTVAPAVSH
jgi:hypothetical protein